MYSIDRALGKLEVTLMTRDNQYDQLLARDLQAKIPETKIEIPPK